MGRRSLLEIIQHSLMVWIQKPRLGDVFGRPLGSYRRRFHRHSLGPQPVAWASIQDERYRVTNISYGGLQVSWQGQTQLLPSAGPIPIVLQILGFQAILEAKVLRSEQGMAELVFSRLTPSDEEFLGDFLTYFDAGIVLKTLPKHLVEQEYKGPGWYSYGVKKGVVAVHLHLDVQGRVDAAHIYCIHGLRQEFTQFSSQGIQVQTLPKSELSVIENRRILLHATSILLGLRQISKTDRLDKLIAAAVFLLQPPPRNERVS